MQNDATKRGSAPSREPSSQLEVYFRNVGSHDLLTHEDELRLAREIESLDVKVWEELLSYPPAVSYVLRTVESLIENSMRSFSTLRGLATTARKRRTKASAESLRKVARKTAARLRAMDLDRRAVDAVRASVARAASGSRARLGFDPTSRGFARWRDRIEGLVREALRVRREFINANLRLVITVARKYRLGGMPFEDLIQEGNLGLMKAVDRYDYRRGLRFSTYATWWIRHNVGRAIAEKSRTIRLPVHIVDSRQRVSRVRRELSSRLGRAPTVQEIADATELPVHKVEILEGRLPERRMSLDQPMGDEDGDRSRMDIFRDPEDDESSPLDALEAKTTAVLVRDLVSRLKPIEADVLRLRFGLEDDKERTLQSVAEKYGLSRERIRQIQEEAFSKMRRMLRSEVH